MPSLPRRAYRYYSTHGLSGLLSESTDYVTRAAVRRRATSAETLPEGEHKRIWYGDGEPPVTISEPSDERLREAFREWPMEFYPDRGFVAELQDCHLVGENGVGLQGGRRLILETSGHRTSDEFVGSCAGLLAHSAASALGRRPDRVERCVFPLLSPDPSYYHWLLEYLPKLRFLERYEAETGARPSVIIEPEPRSYVVETLEAAGYGPDRYEQWDGENAVVADLVVATHRPHLFSGYDRDFCLSRADIAWLRNRMRSEGEGESRTEPHAENVYISRQHVERGRKVENFAAVSAVLDEYGFESYVLEEYSFSEQLSILRDAETIVGPHGAGLANAIFATEPTLIELFPETIIRPHFYYLAEALGFDYSSLVTEASDRDLLVDTDDLRRSWRRPRRERAGSRD